MSAFDVLAVSAALQLIPLEGPTTTVVTAGDWASVITAMTGQISVSTVVATLATLVTASLSARRAWIEIENCSPVSYSVKSLSARRAWIEIQTL